jgi:hypothetical protein
MINVLAGNPLSLLAKFGIFDMSDPNTTLSCYSCHKALDLAPAQKIIKNEECPHCYASLHCCNMCKFHEKTAYNECREPNAERIVEKEKANYCDFFVLTGGGDPGEEMGKMTSAANALFKD